MWETDYDARLAQWRSLRHSCRDQPLQPALLAINDWWWRAPMVNDSLSWSTTQLWPGPWRLLAHDGFCDLARALGIVYTVLMMQHPDQSEVKLVQAKDSNLVLVNDGKYILNWSPGEVVNILTGAYRRQLEQHTLQQFLGRT